VRDAGLDLARDARERRLVEHREIGMTYSSFMSGLKRAQIEIDRKVLADLAVRDKPAFSKIASQVKASLAH